MTIHIHAGGTTRTLCDQPLVLGDVSWEDAAKAECTVCASYFGRRVP